MMRILNILIAEDDVENQALLKLFLERLGHNVQSVWNGLEALNAVKTGLYDLVFMDLHMPVMDGIEATRHIRKFEGSKKRTLIVILSATVSEKQIQEFKNAGADTYLQKPFNAGRITVLINIFSSESEEILPAETREKAETFLANLPILDMQDSLSRFNNDPHFYLESLHDFLRWLPDRMEKINQALIIRNWHDLTFFAHSLKGVSANLGAKQLSKLASHLEVSSQQEKIRLAGKAYREMTQNINKVIESANQLMEQVQAQNLDIRG